MKKKDVFVIKEEVGTNNNKKKTIVRPLKSGYTYGSPTDDLRIKRSLNRINRRK